jgi:exodeoxyribonuclease V alpha subunit
MKVYLGSPAAARAYLEADRGRADDYYLAEGAGFARRFAAAGGRVRELAALAGDGYEAWVAGRDPSTWEPRGRLRCDGRAVRFVEVVVNGPKSWSLAAALHPEIAAAYDAAQDRAATQIIGWLAAHATTRVGPRGGQVQVPVEALEAVTVRHYTSRAGDPHRHLHLQINARVFAAGKWRGLHTVGVRDSLGAINGIGHAAVACDPQLRAALAAHGYTLDATGEIRQLADYVGPFSARAAQIGRNADRYEAEWTAAHPGEYPGPALRRAWDARAWAEGRPDKITPRPGAELTGRWRAELAALGYRDPGGPVALVPSPIGGLDRDAAAELVLSRLAAGRSAWNTADIRGEVEQLIAAAGIVADAAVRTELAEDVTARALARCVPLLSRDGMSVPVPEHIRAWTSQSVLDVEADLAARLAARGTRTGTDVAGPQLPLPLPLPLRVPAGLDAGQTAAIAALAGTRELVVVEGAAGAGKTTTLSAARRLLETQGRRLVLAAPTLKAAKVAAAELGATAGSAAWLAFQHGWRWTADGAWTRLAVGQADPVTGHGYAGPVEGARLRDGDLLVVDEAGMLDQDTARALLTVADECRVRIALLGDRHQLAAVGRGGVLDLAAEHADPADCLTLQAVHRFTRTDAGGRSVPDSEYAELTLAMRTGENSGAVFDALVARGQIRLHPDAADRQAAVAAIAADHHRRGERVAVVVDTREQAAELNAAIRERLAAAGRVDDTRVATTRAGQRIGAGDRIATRRNDRGLRVANRDLWTVTAVGPDGQLTVTPADASPAAAGERVLPAGYVAEHVELAYAGTAHGAQGDTVTAAHTEIGEHTGAASAYVGMTRGRTANTAHLIAADEQVAREQWIAVFGRDRADIGPAHAAALAAAEAARYAPSRPLEQAVADLHEAWTAEQRCLDRLALATSRRELLLHLAELEAGRADRLTALETTCRQAATEAARTRQQAGASAAAVAVEAARLSGQLSAAWHAQRDAAPRAARIVLEGPGRLGLRRAAVARAAERLTAWADTWRPWLPAMPTDPHRIATLAGSADDGARLRAAFDDSALRHAESAHPEHARLTAEADAAQAAHELAHAHLTHARQQLEERRAGLDATGHPVDPAEQLADAERDVAVAVQQLTAARARITQLRAEPALFSQPTDRLTCERDRWRTRYDLEENAPGPAGPDPPRSRPGVRAPAPTPIGHVTQHTNPRLGMPR